MHGIVNACFGSASKENKSVLKIVVRGMAVMLVAVALTLFGPGLIAVKDHVFRDVDVQKRLPTEAGLSLQAYTTQYNLLNNSIVSLREELNSLTDARQQKDFDFYIHLLEERQKELLNLQPSVFAK